MLLCGKGPPARKAVNTVKKILQKNYSYMKLGGEKDHWPMKKTFNFGANPDHTDPWIIFSLCLTLQDWKVFGIFMDFSLNVTDISEKNQAH